MKIKAWSKFCELEINIKVKIKDKSVTEDKVANVIYDMLRAQEFNATDISISDSKETEND